MGVEHVPEPSRGWTRRLRIPPAISVIGNQGFISAANLAISFFLIRVIGVELFGVYAVCFAIAYGVNAISNALVSLPLVSTASRKSEAVRRSMIQSSAIALGGMFSAMILVALGLEILLRVTIDLTYPITLVATFGVSLGAVEFGRRQFFLVGNRAGAWKIDLTRFSLLAVSFTAVLFSPWRLDPYAYVLCFTVANLIALALFGVPAVLSKEQKPTRRKLISEISYVARHGRWLSLSTVLQLLSDQAILLLVAAISGNFAAGVVRTCQMIVGIVNPVLMSLENILPKRLGELLRARGPAEAGRTFWVEASVLVLGIYAILAVIFLFAPQIIDFVTDGDLKEYDLLLRLFCVVWAFYSLKSVLTVVLRSRLQMRTILTADAVATIVAVPTAFLLIPGNGAYGAVIGMILSQVCTVLFLALRLYVGRPPAAQTEP